MNAPNIRESSHALRSSYRCVSTMPATTRNGTGYRLRRLSATSCVRVSLTLASSAGRWNAPSSSATSSRRESTGAAPSSRRCLPVGRDRRRPSTRDVARGRPLTATMDPRRSVRLWRLSARLDTIDAHRSLRSESVARQLEARRREAVAVVVHQRRAVAGHGQQEDDGTELEQRTWSSHCGSLMIRQAPSGCREWERLPSSSKGDASGSGSREPECGHLVVVAHQQHVANHYRMVPRLAFESSGKPPDLGELIGRCFDEREISFFREHQ